MAEEKFRRKLTAILSADVAGYSRLMGEDEEATVRTLTSYREIMGTLIQKHQGRVVDSPGDNLLAEFASVLDAVRSAVEIQEELKARNAQLPDDRKMEFRIGINLGDVIEEGERIYGDGVNIAARVEGLAEPGGICISGTVYEHIKDKLALWEEYLGEHAVKNIKEPVRIYRVRMEPGPEAPKVPLWRRKTVLAGALAVLVAIIGLGIWNFYFRPPPIERASVERMAYPLSDKPSIAVLPFTNMSEDTKQEYFSDGITEEIITGLSKMPQVFVIARNSTFTYKGKPVKIQQVSEELGVRYVLEGSFRKVGDRVRVTAQLIDATTGHHLWAERYDRDLKDIFALQDEITMKIMRALEVRLTEGQQARIEQAKGTDNLEAYVKILQGMEYFGRLNIEGNLLARQMAEEAIALDPEYSRPYRILALTHMMDTRYGSSKSPRESLARAEELAQKALSLDDSDPCSHDVLSFIYLLKREHERAIAEGERSVALDPNGADGHANLGMSLCFAGRLEQSVASFKKAIRLNPFAPSAYFHCLGHAYRMMGRYGEAIAAYKKALHRKPNNLFALTGLAATYSLSGREEEAHAAAAKVLGIHPKFSVEGFAKTTPFKNQADTERFIDTLRKAGLK
ncbi:MAG: tetratricopeptide repeat protein [Desulfobacteraceae bacterium]|nr:tetratricopeptide repeat protein [Desulfobacteraceae bacterium]